MSEMELKACPFCGELPTTRFRVSGMNMDFGDMVDFEIVCTNCGTNKTVRLKINRQEATFMDVDKAMEDATKVWNRRANDGKEA